MWSSRIAQFRHSKTLGMYEFMWRRLVFAEVTCTIGSEDESEVN